MMECCNGKKEAKVKAKVEMACCIVGSVVLGGGCCCCHSYPVIVVGCLMPDAGS